MNLKQIFQALSENRDDTYYVRLSSSEVLIVPVLIELAADGGYNQRMRAFTLLDKISRLSPEKVSPFAEYVLNVLDLHNDFPAWCIWNVIANIAACSEKFEKPIAERLIRSLSSDNISEFSVACECAPRIVAAFPEIRASIEEVLGTVEERDFIFSREVSDSCREVASDKAKDYFRIVENIIDKPQDDKSGKNFNIVN